MREEVGDLLSQLEARAGPHGGNLSRSGCVALGLDDLQPLG